VANGRPGRRRGTGQRQDDLRWIEQGHLQARRQPGGRLRIHRDWYAEMIAGTGRMLASVGDEGGD